MSQQLLEILKARFGADALETHNVRGDETVVVDAARWREIALFLRDDPACSMNMLVDLCAVDYPNREPRFEVVAHLLSLARGHRLRLKARVGGRDGNDAALASLVQVWPGANWFERETFDMMGIRFDGHPDLRRILMYEEFEGHPLRKDYPAGKTQPLVPYREGPDVLDKIAPFGTDEGMSFGRKHRDYEKGDA